LGWGVPLRHPDRDRTGNIGIVHMKRTMLGVGTVVLLVAGGCLASRDDSPKVDLSTQPVVEGSVIRVIPPATAGVPAAISVDIGTDAPFEAVLAYSVPVWCGDMVEAYADELDLLLPEGTLVTIERPAIAEGAGFGWLHQMVGESDASAYGVDTVVLGEDTAAWEVDGAVEREDAVVYAAMHGMEGHPSTEVTSVNELLIRWGAATLYPPLDHSEAAAPIEEQLSTPEFASVPAGYFSSFAEAEMAAWNTRAGATGICRADDERRVQEEAERIRVLEERYGPDRLPNTEDDPNRDIYLDVPNVDAPDADLPNVSGFLCRRTRWC
jgi:hypothetical protein